MADEQSADLANVWFTHDGAVSPLFERLNVHFPRGFTGVIGPNGCGKTTLLQLVCGLVKESDGAINIPQKSVYCPQRTDDPPEQLAAFLQDADREAYALRGRLGIDAAYLDRWPTLSHGERKRTQIGCALWEAPSLLAIDEPTNHIDADGRRLLISALHRYRGICVIVSHDRDLLDELCHQCLMLEPPNYKLFKGGYSQATKLHDLAHQQAVEQRGAARLAQARLQREITTRRNAASRANKDRSKKGLSRKDHDAKEKIDRVRVSGKDGQAGRLLNQMQSRAARADEDLQNATVSKRYETGIWMAGSISPRSHLLRLEAGELPLGQERSMHYPALHMAPTDRIAITGSNGLGKSTLVTHLLDHANVSADHLVHLPQEITANQGQQILADTKILPPADLGQVMNIVSRLGSRPGRLLESRQPSPGELRKLLLALGMVRQPHFIVMDEPTNHLDLLSIEALENALVDCPCGLLLVSHDQRFMDRLTTAYWRLEGAADADTWLTFD